jgi:GcrA cell cycle regulator
MIWTAAATKRVERLWASGLSGNQIAKLMGTTRNAIIGKARRMGLPARKISQPVLKKKIARKPKSRPVFQGTSDAVMALVDGLCKYPYGEPCKENFRFCMKSTENKGVYCSEHQGLCYMPTRYPIVRAGKFMK